MSLPEVVDSNRVVVKDTVVVDRAGKYIEDTNKDTVTADSGQQPMRFLIGISWKVINHNSQDFGLKSQLLSTSWACSQI